MLTDRWERSRASRAGSAVVHDRSSISQVASTFGRVLDVTDITQVRLGGRLHDIAKSLERLAERARDVGEEEHLMLDGANNSPARPRQSAHTVQWVYMCAHTHAATLS